ncbi:MAG: tetratricopeptide repeat protein, partial [Treponema sp.]|nr:tetratricopeptide repeat protein [Treponema sp.]
MDESNSLSEGISLYNQKNYADALTSFLSISTDDVNPVEVAYYVGLCYSKLERYDDALLYLEQVVTAEGEMASDLDFQRVLQCRYLLAVIYCTTGRRKLADFELKQLLDLGYKKASVYASLAFISWEEDNVEKCIEYYNKSLAEDSENPTALNGLGYVLA